MKALEFRKKTEVEVSKQLSTLKAKIADLVRDASTAEKRNVREIRAIRKDIARALTVLHEKQKEAK